MLKGANYKHDDREPQRQDFACSVPSGDTKYYGHTNHGVGGNGTKEYLSPIFLNQFGTTFGGNGELTEVIQLGRNELVKVLSVLRIIEQFREITDKVCD